MRRPFKKKWTNFFKRKNGRIAIEGSNNEDRDTFLCSEASGMLRSPEPPVINQVGRESSSENVFPEQENLILDDKPLHITEESDKSNSLDAHDLNCPICFEVMENSYKTTCSHIFCTKCIIKMFKNKSDISCPMCRTKLQNDNITKIIKPVYDIPENPDFNFMNNDHEKDMLVNAYNTLSRLNKWEFLKNYDPNPELGFMFDNNEEINNIKTQINIDNYENHSGLSLGLTMRHMNYIAKHGFTIYKESLGVYE